MIHKLGQTKDGASAIHSAEPVSGVEASESRSLDMAGGRISKQIGIPT
jgi:hypothetical protein